MTIWNPGDPDFHVVHQDPHSIALGSDPGDYLFDFMEEFPLIVNLMHHAGHDTPKNKVVMHYSMMDADYEQFVPDQERSEQFLRAVNVFASTGPSYWHCHAGINRSSYMVAAYLHLYRGMAIDEAIRLLRAKRSHHVLCNTSFEKALITRYTK